MIDFRNPYEEVVAAASEVFPELDCSMDFSEDFGGMGATGFKAGARTIVLIDVNQSILSSIETIAHELAHVAVGIDEGHGPVWKDAFQRIHNAYAARVGIEPQELRLDKDWEDEEAYSAQMNEEMLDDIVASHGADLDDASRLALCKIAKDIVGSCQELAA